MCRSLQRRNTSSRPVLIRLTLALLLFTCLPTCLLYSADLRATSRAPAFVPPPAPVIQYPITVGTEKQLFVDDVVVESMQGVRQTFHAATKYDKNPIMIPDKPWETQANCILPLSITRIPESENLRVWYSVWGKQVNLPTLMCVADSTDGIHWEKPNLGLFDFNGSKDNNIIREGRMFRVLYDPRELDTMRRYKAIIREPSFMASFSEDGLTWRKTAPVLQTAFDATSIHWDPVGEKWIASCKQVGPNDERVRGYAESKDFLNWTDIFNILRHDEKDPPGLELYSLTIARYESVYIGILKVYYTAAGRCDLQMAYSRDAKHWERPVRTPFLANGPDKKDFDYGNIDNADGPIRMGDELWFYYAGRSTLHNFVPNDGSMGLAKLRLDGFASVGGPDQEGTLTTRTLLLKGNSLYVNADATGGELRVEVLPGEGFELGRCLPITTDGVRQEIRWKDITGLKSLHEKPVQLRFHLNNAKLYSFWME